MVRPPRDFAALPESQVVAADVALPAGIMARLYSVVAEFRGAVRNKDQILEELVDGYLDAYVADVLRPRLGSPGRTRKRPP